MTRLEPRPYQEEAIAAAINSLKKSSMAKHPLVVLPTGSGKSLVMAEIIKRLHQKFGIRIQVLTHVRELIRQDYRAILQQWGADSLCPIGIHSAGLGEKSSDEPIIVGGIQTVANSESMRGHWDLVMIDEAHLVPKSSGGRYRTHLDALMEANPKLRVMGFTATHYRLDGGLLHRGDDRVFTDVVCNIPVDRLIKEGYLCNLRGKGTDAEIDTSKVKRTAGDFNLKELAEAAMVEGETQAAIDETVGWAEKESRKCWLLFAISVDHANEISSCLSARGVSHGIILGSTPSHERDLIAKQLESGEITAIINIGCLTTGFDCPRIDLLAVLRPTDSTSLYVQIMGRGMRIHADKKDCLVLDFGGNISRHGPINRINIEDDGKGKADPGEAPVKRCPACSEMILIAMRKCPSCGYEFDIRGSKHDRRASGLHPVEWEPAKPKTRSIDGVSVSRHTKRGKPDSMRVTYASGMKTVSEWVCFEHDGFPRKLAEEWWKRFMPAYEVPSTVSEAMQLVHAMRRPTSMSINDSGKYPHLLATHHEGVAKYQVMVFAGRPSVATDTIIDDADLPF